MRGREFPSAALSSFGLSPSAIPLSLNLTHKAIIHWENARLCIKLGRSYPLRIYFVIFLCLLNSSYLN
jgi:hypothetical protein